MFKDDRTIYNKKNWVSGNGEFISFTVLSVCIAAILILIVALLQMTYASSEISKAISATSRSIIMCDSIEDAAEQAQRVAKSSISSPAVSDIEVSVDMVDEDADWETGSYCIVTLFANVKTIEPYVLSGIRKKSALVCLEAGTISDAMEICKICMYAVETGGNVYGQCDYASFEPARYGQIPGAWEPAITIGAGGEFGSDARKLLLKIRTEYPDVFTKYDNAGISNDIDTCNWDTYDVAAGSAKANAIIRIIDSPEGHKCQDELMYEQIEVYFDHAESMGITNDGAKIEFANVEHQGGQGGSSRIARSAAKPYTVDSMYNAIMSDSVYNIYRDRQLMFYNAIKQNLRA